MDNLISKEELFEALIHCKGLGRRSLEAVIQTINKQKVYDLDMVIHDLEEAKFPYKINGEIQLIVLKKRIDEIFNELLV